MKNNKGFTIIELAVSFCLVAAVAIILLQLVLAIKEVYLSGDIKTTLLIKQGIMTKKIYEDLNDKELTSVTSCGLSCLAFTYSDGTTSNLLVDPGNKTVTYADYTIKLDNSSYFGQLNFTKEQSTEPLGKTDSLFKIDIPIISKLLDDDFGIHIVKTYNSSNTTINNQLSLENTIVTLSGVETTIEPLTNSEGLKSVFIKIFHQEANNYITEFDGFIKNKEPKTLSTLVSLDAFKTEYNKDKVIEEETTNINSLSLTAKEKEKEINKFKEAYQRGYYSLLLNYNDKALSSGNYAWWYQTSNFANKETLFGFSTYPTGNIGTGITYSANSDSWAIAGTYTLGNKTGNIIGFDGTATSVDLYVEAREYICNYSLSDVTYNSISLRNTSYTDGYICVIEEG